ncbi:hypothetical protein [Legionella micdadei]|uniref:Legionella vir region protein LvrA n=1 Tax=Legionella micdadei TaxID=451 RepID=A0A098GJP7_LEGMI|nr:hypothetical protein [Legionella micdadei]KTD28833.1 vir region protein [Legionella micdadei]CEG62210.1 Legionella vir region protein LvrA [Legionella micdadei]SCY07255.1 hypothetical protein SAMN02982997_00784 [Legionella micdadei]
MMDFVINGDELAAMSGLPHIQQLAYLRGIRPYMDVNTGITGIKRRISYQSISEQLYIEPHQGIKSQSFSRDQVRRAVSGLERAGMIEVQSDGMQLILKCPLASRDFSVQNKAAINPPQKATTNPHDKSFVNKGISEVEHTNADIAEPQKAAIPHNDNYYIFLFKQFEKFWELYPIKRSQQKAWEIFQQLNPSEDLVKQILAALKSQITFIQKKQARDQWVPNWKNPANWLSQQCWKDELTMELPQEEKHATNQTNYPKQQATDLLWDSCSPGSKGSERSNANVIFFPKWGSKS